MKNKNSIILLTFNKINVDIRVRLFNPMNIIILCK